MSDLICMCRGYEITYDMILHSTIYFHLEIVNALQVKLYLFVGVANRILFYYSFEACALCAETPTDSLMLLVPKSALYCTFSLLLLQE